MLTKSLFVLMASVAVHGYLKNGTWSSEKRPFTSRITRVLCPGQPYKYSVMHQCKVKLMRDQPSLITLIGTILEPQPEVHASMTLNYKYTVYKPLLMDFKWNLCQFLSDNSEHGSSPMVNIIFKILQETLPSIAQSKCPLNGTYTVKDYAVQDNMLPPIVPAGEYRNDIRLYRPDNETLFFFQLYGFVRARGLADLSLG